MSKVAIIGSCITRDLWPIRGDAAENLLYVSRTSLASLFSAPVEGFQPRGELVGELRRHQHNALVTDLTKTGLRRLVDFRPTHLIFDFIDERYDLLGVGPSIVVRSWELEVSGYLAQDAFRGARRIPRLSAACERLWRDGAEEMAAFVRGTPLSEAKLILHVSRWAAERQGPDGRRAPLTDVQILPGEPAEVDEHNALLAAYEAWFQEVMPPMARIDPAERRVADETHQWGLSPFHYAPDYYAAVLRRLERLGVERGFTEQPAWPSAPAA